MTTDRFNDLVRLTEAERQALLDRLDFSARGAEGKVANQRLERRIDYRRERVPLLVEHPAGGVSRLLVCVRNLSGGGMAFIHGGFVYEGSRCKIVLFRNDGQPAVVTGTVRSCRSLQGALHEIGVSFDQRLEVAEFVPADRDGEVARTPKDLCGTVLAIGFPEIERRLFEHAVKPTGIRLRCANDQADAQRAIKGEFVDIVLADVGTVTEPSLAIVRAVREAGYDGIVVAVGSTSAPAAATNARGAGATEYVARPIDHAGLLALLSALHARAGAVTGSDPVFSNLDGQEDTQELLQNYVEQVHGAASTLLEALRAGNAEVVRSQCLSIQGSAAGYGFPALSAAADAAIARLEATSSLTAATASVRRLQLLCAAVAARGESCPAQSE